MMNIVWFRRDLRIEDNPALFYACEKSEPVLAVYISSQETWASHNMSQCQQVWIKKNLDYLKENLKKLNIPLIILKGSLYSNADKILAKLAGKFNVNALYFNREYEFDETVRDNRVADTLAKMNIKLYSYHDQCLIPPDALLNKEGKPYIIFTPYKNSGIKLMRAGELPRKYYPKPKKIKNLFTIDAIDEFTPTNCKQDISWLKPGEKAAHKTLVYFLDNHLSSYDHNRNIPLLDSTSHLSPYLAIGAISTRICLDKLLETTKNFNLNELLDKSGSSTWLSELLWRDFYKMICYHFPRVSRGQPFKLNTSQLTWSDSQEHYNCWTEGKTGVPIIDSAMRQMNQTGWMHNRLRMIVAMYFTKNLWQDWRRGEAYFASRLIDWDFSANNGGWQWSASTGNDAAPYFRIFNPILQSERFDPTGDFIRKYCTELSGISNKAIHYPSERFKGKLSYPSPIVDLKESRAAAIQAFKNII